MSAPAQNYSLSASYQRCFSEVELLRAVSHLTWNAATEEQALSAIAAAVLRVPGLTAFRFEPYATVYTLPVLEASQPQATALRASAVSDAAAGGHTWGQVRIFFTPSSPQLVESPVRLARYIGQQLGLLLHRLSMLRQVNRQVAHRDAIQRIMRRRKIIHRAVQVLAEQRHVSPAEALSHIVKYARRNRQNLLHISESLIFGYDTAAFAQPFLPRFTNPQTKSQNLQRSLA